MGVPFTQYIRPDGRTRETAIDRPPEVEAKAAEVVAAGYYFTSEAIPGGLVNLECCDAGEVVAGVLAANGPEVPAAVDRLVEEAHAAVCRVWTITPAGVSALVSELIDSWPRWDGESCQAAQVEQCGEAGEAELRRLVAECVRRHLAEAA